ncbi:hypothetical protein F5Y03DRAFT_364363 [Xylaria venustula]|nr:hypothetical protein F5Y03DRAFT_364363 [Xylaria venustula]
MSPPNWMDGRHLIPPSSQKMSPRNSQNAVPSTIVIEPTPEYQQFYNQNRREVDRQRLEIHLAENRGNSLGPPSRSTTSDSHASPSTVCSHAGDGTTPLSPDPTSETGKSKPHRGRRKGPLDMETRTKVAFKRKFKLTCAFHRIKRTSCNCHDFSKLEENYQKYRAAENGKTKAPRSPSVRPFGDLGTFGTGGASGTALTIAQYENFDLPDLPSGRESTPHVSASLLPVLGLDIDSADSVNAIVSAPREEPFFMASASPMPLPMQDADNWPVAIGCSMPFRNRWECKYQIKTGEQGSETTKHPQCPWTGPFKQLVVHFRTEHHPFDPAVLPHSTMCEICDEFTPEWVEEVGCKHTGHSVKWFYGALSHQPTSNPPLLTVSEASGSRSTWPCPPGYTTTPGTSNAGQSNLPYSSSNSYEHSTSGNESSEVDDGDGKDGTYGLYTKTQNCCRLQPDTPNNTRDYYVRSWISLVKREAGAMPTFYSSYLSSMTLSKPWRLLVLSLLAPLILFRLRRAQYLNKLIGALKTLVARVYCFEICLVLIVILGPPVARIALGNPRSRESGENGLHALAPVI